MQFHSRRTMNFLQKTDEAQLLTNLHLEIHLEKNKDRYKKISTAAFTCAHFFLGLYIFWVIKYSIDTKLGADSPLKVRAFIETAWLLTGIYWGNMGWDIRKQLIINGTLREAFRYIVQISAPTMILLPGILYTFIAYYNLHKYDHSLINTATAPAIIWIVAAVIALLIFSFYRKISKA